MSGKRLREIVVGASAIVVGAAGWSMWTAAAEKPVGQSPRLEVTEAHFDLGVKQLGAHVAAKFSVANRGGKRLALVEAAGCCGSLGRQALIAPGSSETIAVQVNVPPEVGQFRQTFVFTTNDPDQPTMELSVSGLAVDSH